MIKSTNGRKKNCNYCNYNASDTVTTVRRKKKRKDKGSHQISTTDKQGKKWYKQYICIAAFYIINRNRNKYNEIHR